VSASRRGAGGRAKFAEKMSGRFPGGSEVGHLLDDALDMIEKVSLGLPRKHQETHLQTGDDHFPAPGTPVDSNLNLGGAPGTAANYARSDHRHGIVTPLTTKGDFLTRDASIYARLAVPADGMSWVADSTQPLGWRAVALATAAEVEESAYLALIAPIWR
jgi:hypothetical protein